MQWKGPRCVDLWFGANECSARACCRWNQSIFREAKHTLYMARASFKLQFAAMA
jgi:hypothetical protein